LVWFKHTVLSLRAVVEQAPATQVLMAQGALAEVMAGPLAQAVPSLRERTTQDKPTQTYASREV
jgi:hypothetical protein